MPTYYPIFTGHGRAILADTLDAEDPFGLDPRVIVERITTAGYAPMVEYPRDTPWPAPGATYEVGDEGRVFLVTIGRDAETIVVQEVRENGDEHWPE